MKILLDTNIIIPLEPTSATDVRGTTTGPIANLYRLAQESGFQVFIHPAVSTDLDRDKNTARRNAREILLQKYLPLPDPPITPKSAESILGNPPAGSNDWVDNLLIASILQDAVDFLVSEDLGIHKKAKALGIANRVLRVEDALSVIRGLFPAKVPVPSTIRECKAHTIDPEDPILDSFRKDYPGFNQWFSKVRLEHRLSWIIPISGSSHVKGFVIVNWEDKDMPAGLSGKVLKICSFKISDEYQGFRFGELLLKSVFAYARSHECDWVFVTVFEKYQQFIELMQDFGFTLLDEKTRLGESILAKPIRFTNDDMNNSEPFLFHVTFGPEAVNLCATPVYIVPIQPQYNSLLFPEGDPQGKLFEGVHPFGNSIRKAYLSNASIRRLCKGDTLLFYASQGDSSSLQAVTSLGIVEDAMVSQEPEEIARFSGKRTVYRFEEIQEMCARGVVLAILFRQVKVLRQDAIIPLSKLIENGVVKAPPQTIQQVPEEVKPWIQVQFQI